jgi:hypothetical protein
MPFASQIPVVQFVIEDLRTRDSVGTIQFNHEWTRTDTNECRFGRWLETKSLIGERSVRPARGPASSPISCSFVSFVVLNALFRLHVILGGLADAGRDGRATHALIHSSGRRCGLLSSHAPQFLGMSESSYCCSTRAIFVSIAGSPWPLITWAMPLPLFGFRRSVTMWCIFTPGAPGVSMALSAITGDRRKTL